MSKKKKPRKNRSRQRQARSLAHLKRRVKEGPMADSKLITTPRGQVKMSEVLERFVEPYLDEIDETLQSHHKLFSLATVAWNTALLPEDKRREMLEEAVDAAMKGALARDKQELRNILAAMIERKLAYFGEYKQFIVDFELIPAGIGYHLSVASTVAGVPPHDQAGAEG